MAVELAKVSLWLHSFTIGAPLSFLDHHLRCGNSLIGTTAREAEAAMSQDSGGQFTLLSGPFVGLLRAAEIMRGVSVLSDATFAEVEQSETLFRSFDQAAKPYKRLLDIYVSKFFGLKRADHFLRVFDTNAIAADPKTMNAADAAVYDDALKLSDEKHFFHWDLEFPEVFIDLETASWKERPGFDAVVGNPPYVRQEGLSEFKPFFQAVYESYSGVADLYTYFYEKGLKVLRRGGFSSYIVTNKWLRAGYGEALRRFFAANSQFEEIVDFGHAPIFADADTFPCIVVVRKPLTPHASTLSEIPPSTDKTVRICPVPREALAGIDLDGYVESEGYDVPWSRFSKAPWSLDRPDVGALMEKIQEVGILLSEYIGSVPRYGIKTGFNKAFLFDEATKNQLIRDDPKSVDIIRPYLRGQDVKRWTDEWSNLWMIVASHGIDIEQYPAIKKHLSFYKTELEPAPKDWNPAKSGKWTGRKYGKYKWYELQDNFTDWEIFENPKIVWQDLAFHSRFCLDEQGLFSEMTCFCLPSADLYLLAVLNSPLMWSWLYRNTVHGKDEVLRLKNIYTETIPIAPPTDEIREQTEPKVQRLIDLTKTNQQSYRDVLDWMQSRFGIDKLGQKLERFATLSEAEFLTELRKRIPQKGKTGDPLGVAGQKEMKKFYGDYALPMQTRNREVLQLEHQISDLVNQAYGLTPEDIDLMWRTAPPRMPIQRTTQPISDAIG